jgi:hypothetical protein
VSATLDGARLTNSRLLARNVGLNALGWLLPMLLALGAIPVLVRTLGTDRFGVLSLVWTLVGYFSLFDLGLGRAVTQLVAERLGREQREDLPGLVWTATWLLVPLGIVGGAAVALLAPWAGGTCAARVGAAPGGEHRGVPMDRLRGAVHGLDRRFPRGARGRAGVPADQCAPGATRADHVRRAAGGAPLLARTPRVGRGARPGPCRALGRARVERAPGLRALFAACGRPSAATSARSSPSVDG